MPCFTGSPERVLLAIDIHEDFVNAKRFAIATMLSLQLASIKRYELDAPEAN